MRFSQHQLVFSYVSEVSGRGEFLSLAAGFVSSELLSAAAVVSVGEGRLQRA